MKTNGTKPISLNFAVDELDYLLKTRSKEELVSEYEELEKELEKTF